MKQNIFAKIYEDCRWGEGDFRSGSGRDLEEVKRVALLLALVFDKYGWKTLADIGCGDFTWMRTVLHWLNIEAYIGIDIVKEIVDENKEKYKYVEFEVMDIVTDKLPLAQIALVKDVLPHLSYYYIDKAMKNICKVGYEYIILTGYFNKMNKNIKTGSWRKINWTKAPFNLPEPLEIIRQNEIKALLVYDNEVLSKRFL